MPEIPRLVVETARAMTRAARRETHDDPDRLRCRRNRLLARYDYAARVRGEESGAVLVCYPEDWVEDGVYQPEAVTSTDDAVERSLWSTDRDDDWETAAAHNRDLAATVRDRHGEVHGANAAAFGTYMANHHTARVEAATAEQVRDFLEEYYPRNEWPSAQEAAAVRESLEHLFAAAGEPFPLDAPEP
jgi:hypothetical protein